MPAAPQNVFGKPLQACSSPGMAMTGFTRDGKCVETGDDTGSHHICLDMSNLKENFCVATDQPDWCSQPMQCIDAPGNCPIKYWCVCQWAFVQYLANTKTGCDEIKDIKCDAVNMAALKAYRSKGTGDAQIAAALD